MIEHDYNLDRYNYLKKIGKCVRCGHQEAVPGMTQCPDCLYEQEMNYNPEKHHERHLTRYQRRSEMGLCVSCGNRAVEGRKRCQRCLDKAKYEARFLRTNNRVWKAGLCLANGCYEKPVEGKKYCEKHLLEAQSRIISAINAIDTSNHPWRKDETVRRKNNMKQRS